MIQINKGDVRYFLRRWLLSLQLQKGSDFAVHIRVLTIREPEGRNKSEQVMTWLFVAKSEPCAFLYLNTEQGVGGMLSRAGATGLEVRSADPFKGWYASTGLWIWYEQSTFSQWSEWREGGDTGRICRGGGPGSLPCSGWVVQGLNGVLWQDGYEGPAEALTGTEMTKTWITSAFSCTKY